MATNTKTTGTSRPRGGTAGSALPKMATHIAIAERMSVTPETVRSWVASDPPAFPRPTLVINNMLYWEEARIDRYLKTGVWE